MQKLRLKYAKRLPIEFSSVTQALNDLKTVCFKNNIWYLVGGSTAILAACGEYLKIPQDVDAICDESKEKLVASELIKLGYKLIPLPKNSIINRIKKHYVKDKKIIDIAFGKLTPRGFELTLPMLVPGLLLVFSKSMVRPEQYRLGDIKFLGFSREALWFGLGGFMGTIDAMGEKVDKRKNHLILLSKGLNTSKVKDIEESRPGIYLNNTPLVIPSNKLLLYLTNIGIKVWNSILRHI